MTVIKNGFNLVLEIDKSNGGGENISRYEVSHCSAGFAVNRLPTATCALAVGRSVFNLDPAQIHRDAGQLKLMFPTKVWLTVTGSWDGFNDFDWTGAGRQLIFDGYLTGIGYSKIRGKMRFTVQLIHWLSDLAFSSTLSNQSHPSNPSEISFRDAYESPCADTTAAPLKALSVRDRFFTFFERDKITKDLWGQCLHPLLCCLAREDAAQFGLCGGPDGRLPNDASLAALSRIETDTSAKHACGVGRRWSSPLALGGGLFGNALAKGISRYIGDQTVQSYWNTTMWDKIIQEFGPTFKFSVVPLVDSATIVPYMPGLRPTWQKAIFADEIDTIDVASFIRRPLRGVGIWAGRELRAAASSRQTAGLYGTLRAGGCYVPDAEAKGMLLTQRAPGWLINVAGAATRPDVSTVGAGNGGARSPTSTATTPLEGDSGPAPDTSAVQEMKNTASVYEALARWIYVAEVLRGRNGSVRTKFRMDIAPGSNVQIFTLGERFVQAALGKDELRAGLVGTVQRVGITLDAETPHASTTFHFTNLRTREENEDDRTSAPFHPLYPPPAGSPSFTNQFTGAPLVDAYLFP